MDNKPLADFLPAKTAAAVVRILEKNLRGAGAVKVYAFGSRVKGGARADSDIDLAIKTAGPLPVLVWSQLEEDFQESDIPQKVDVVDFHRVTDGFRKLILDQGCCVWETP
ncbi:MAG: nucleotidyltransferase domain-containing protein [Deltaproteobacteria bacterium]|nr:nucleotidyltransferase domain-containing protein [Deltaproteobacteria bacterium]